MVWLFLTSKLIINRLPQKRRMLIMIKEKRTRNSPVRFLIVEPEPISKLEARRG